MEQTVYNPQKGRQGNCVPLRSTPFPCQWRYQHPW